MEWNDNNDNYFELEKTVINLIKQFVPGREPDLTLKVGKSKLEIKCHKSVLQKSPVINLWIAKSRTEEIRADEILFLQAIAVSLILACYT